MNDDASAFRPQVPDPSEITRLAGESVALPGYGGRLDVRRDPGTRITPVGGLAFFAAFLRNTGLFDRLCGDFPIYYKSDNVCSKRDILGTAVLAILLGKTRCAHIDQLRNDAPPRPPRTWRDRRGGHGAQGTEGCLREEARRMAVKTRAGGLRVASPLQVHYRHRQHDQAGTSEPQLPFVLHWIGPHRAGVDVRPDKQHAGGCKMPCLWAPIDSLPPYLYPCLLRGDVGYGNDGIRCSTSSGTSRDGNGATASSSRTTRSMTNIAPEIMV